VLSAEGQSTVRTNQNSPYRLSQAQAQVRPEGTVWEVREEGKHSTTLRLDQLRGVT
jgi:hypothetical protein